MRLNSEPTGKKRADYERGLKRTIEMRFERVEELSECKIMNEKKKPEL